MAENLQEELQPIKVVFPNDGDYIESTVKPRDFDALCEVTPEIRSSIESKIGDVAKQFSRSFISQPGIPAVARVTLRPEALAKSFRPSEIFNDNSCPIIGVDGPGVLLVSVTAPGLKTSQARINSTAVRATAHVSTIDDIKPFTMNDALKIPDVAVVPVSEKIGFRLFRHKFSRQNELIEEGFKLLAGECGVTNLKAVQYTDTMTVYTGDNVTASAIQTLSRFVGTQSVGRLPDYGLVRQQAMIQRSAGRLDLPSPEPGVRYGLLGLIDSGTDAQNRHLQEWVETRDAYWVPEDDQDTTHGSFVASLAINARGLNNKDLNFPGCRSKIIDVVVVPKGGKINEADLIQRIDYALQTYPKVIVWNMSLALVGETRRLDVMSDLGAALDERSRKYGVLFVLPTGNIDGKPMRKWPLVQPAGDSDLMPSPGDSLRSLTVGGITHIANEATCSPKGGPSPFALRGPGFGGTIKPELSHIAGNSDEDGRYSQSGILAVDGMNLVEDIGVSFAVPCVSTTAANLVADIQQGNERISPTLIKGLMVHSAFTASPPLHCDHIEYTGVGRSRDVPEIANCTQSSATIIFQVPVRRDPEFYKQPFPMPACLNNGGKLQGEVFMTLIYDPPLDKNYTIEYVRTDVTATLGTMRFNEAEGADEYHREIQPVPKNLRSRYASSLVKLGLDWSPMKLYWRRFKKLDPDLRWRLKLERTDRAEWADKTPQDVTLIITIRTLGAARANVYTELVTAMRELGWQFQNLELRSRTRGRGRA